MPKKFIDCVRDLKRKYPQGKYNPYAVCRVSTGFHGSSKDIGLIHPLKMHTKAGSYQNKRLKRAIYKSKIKL